MVGGFFSRSSGATDRSRDSRDRLAVYIGEPVIPVRLDGKVVADAIIASHECGEEFVRIPHVIDTAIRVEEVQRVAATAIGGDGVSATRLFRLPADDAEGDVDAPSLLQVLGGTSIRHRFRDLGH